MTEPQHVIPDLPADGAGHDRVFKGTVPKDGIDGPHVPFAGRTAAIGRGDLFGSVSNLSPEHVKEAVHRFQQAAVLGLHHASQIHYTQSASRWEGIAKRKVAIDGHYPTEADCSAYAAWVLWNALYVTFKHSDTVNGEHWQAGYTGTLLEHGRAVSSPIPGDLIIYGTGFPGEHTACFTGGGLVVSHGSEAGPLLLPWRYRSDVLSIRRYI